MLLRCLEFKGAIGQFQHQMDSAARMNEVEDEAEEVEDREDDDEDYRKVRMATAGAKQPYDPLTDIITEEDWEETERLTNFLVSFYKMTQV